MAGGLSRPSVSVIVPAFDAAATIGDTLAALERQDVAVPYEVIVIDDGSADGTAELAERSPVVTAVLRQNREGAARARNRGAAAARADLLAFTDSDCVPEPGWLRTGLRALEDADLVQGAVEPPHGVRLRPFDRSLWVTRETGLWESANLFVRRDAFARIGGFDGWLDHVGGRPFAEDTWFGWRARRAGERAGFCDDALVRHAVFSRSAREYVAERLRLQYFPAVARQMPEVRDYVYRRWFITRRSAAFDAAVAGAAVAAVRHSPLPLALAAPYCAELARASVRWGRAAPRVAAVDVVADAVGCLALLRGSLRERSVLI